jgi:hypothetical protein
MNEAGDGITAEQVTKSLFEATLREPADAPHRECFEEV